jgi:hypothetical protein
MPIVMRKPFKVWSLDIVGPMPGKRNDKKYIITAIDFATRWPVAQAVKQHNGNNVCWFIGKEIIAKFGQPELLITDGGKELTSKDTKVYLAKQGVNHIVTKPYHPQANGRVEQLNGSLTQALAKLTAREPGSWAQQLPTALLVCRARANRSMGFSPFEMVYGTKPNIIQTLSGPRLEIPKKVPPRSNPNVTRIMDTQPKREAKRIKDSMVPLHNRYNVGDEVWVLNPDQSKLQPEKVGPALVLKVNSNYTYLIQRLGKRQTDKVMHHDCLRLCKARQHQQESTLPTNNQQLSKY